MPTNTANETMQEILDSLTELGPLPIEALSPDQARQIPLMDRAASAFYGSHFSRRALAPLPTPVGQVKNIILPGSEGNLMGRIYTPSGPSPEGGWAVIVYYHGGGWVLADLNTYDASCRALCVGTEAIIVSVHYRQAPENPWPAAANDAFAGYQWVCQNAFSFGGNPNKVAVVGESAGGNLAAVVCLLARDRNFQKPLHQVLIYPVTDLAHGVESPSAMLHNNAKPLNTAMLEWFYNLYAPDGVDRMNPYVSPLHAENLRDLPAATIILAEIDPLRSEGEAYANRLGRANIPVTLRVYEGVTHEFFGLAGLLPAATDAVDLASKNLHAAFEHVSRVFHPFAETVTKDECVLTS